MMEVDLFAKSKTAVLPSGVKLRQFLPPEPESSPGATICGVAERVAAEDIPAMLQVSAPVKINPA
jgi:hypothetical protein